MGSCGAAALLACYLLVGWVCFSLLGKVVGVSPESPYSNKGYRRIPIYRLLGIVVLGGRRPLSAAAPRVARRREDYKARCGTMVRHSHPLVMERSCDPRQD